MEGIAQAQEEMKQQAQDERMHARERMTHAQEGIKHAQEGMKQQAQDERMHITHRDTGHITHRDTGHITHRSATKDVVLQLLYSLTRQVKSVPGE